MNFLEVNFLYGIARQQNINRFSDVSDVIHINNCISIDFNNLVFASVGM